MKETEIRADTPVSFARATVLEAQVKPAVVLHGRVAVSRSLGTFVVPGEEVRGLFDQTMTYVDMSKMTVDLSPTRKGKATTWLGIHSQRRTSSDILRRASQSAQAYDAPSEAASWPRCGSGGGRSG